MGRPKLMLPWQGRPIIAHVLQGCITSLATRTVVVVRSDDQSLVDECGRWDVDLVFNDREMADMKSSVQHALDWIATTYGPSDRDTWLLAPADVVGITSKTINHILDAYDPQAPSIVAPVANAVRGHPVLFPWRYASEVYDLGPQEGVNALLARHGVHEITDSSDAILTDIDTPEDYERLVRG